MTHEKLQRWFDEGGRKKSWFAALVGVTPSAVTLWTQGKRTPDPMYRLMIQVHTGGVVPANAWETQE